MGNISEKLEIIRENLGEKGNAFAEQLGIPYRSYMNYKGGRTPPAELLGKLTELFNVNPVWLLTDQGPMFMEPAASKAEVPTETTLVAEDDEADGWSEAAGADETDETDETDGFSIDDDEISTMSMVSEDNAKALPFQQRLMKTVMDLHEENRRLRVRIEELERMLRRQRSRSRRR